MSKKIATIIVTVIILLGLVGGVVWLFMSGKLVWADGDRQALLYSAVCDSDMVATYNEATDYQYRNGLDQEPVMDEDALRELSNRIKSTEGYELDPTCQVMVVWSSVELGDEAAAKGGVKSLKELHDKRVFPDTNLRTVLPLFEYDTAIESVFNEQEVDTIE
jgi:hypothetical protein